MSDWLTGEDGYTRRLYNGFELTVWLDTHKFKSWMFQVRRDPFEAAETGDLTTYSQRCDSLEDGQSKSQAHADAGTW